MNTIIKVVLFCTLITGLIFNLIFDQSAFSQTNLLAVNSLNAAVSASNAIGNGEPLNTIYLSGRHTGKILTAEKLKANDENSCQIIRFKNDGTIDESFISAIWDQSPITIPAYEPHAIGLQVNDKIVLVGKAVDNSPSKLLVVRLNADGTLDQNFGKDGKLYLDITDQSFITHILDISSSLSGEIYISTGSYLADELYLSSIFIIDDDGRSNEVVYVKYGMHQYNIQNPVATDEIESLIH